MKSSKENLDYLWKQYLNKEATALELEQLFDIIQDMKDEEQVIESLQSELEFHSFEDQLFQDQKNSILDAILKKTQPVPFKDVNPSVPLVHRLTGLRKTWFKYAAVLILVIGSISYFLFQKDDIQNQISETKANNVIREEIKPGGSRATLTLADGSIIILDSLANGTLAQEGNSEIIQIDAGKLVYNNLTDKGSAVALYNIITTPRGGQYQLILADGTKVWLNASSSLRFPIAFIGKERTVELTGEGYFEVAHNANMPFHVKVNEMEVQVLGTHFNINSYSDEPLVKTTLLEGSVKVIKGSNNVILKPGEQALVPDMIINSINKIRVHRINSDDVVAWKNGFFSFRHSGLKEVMRQLSRWYDIEVNYKGNIEKQEFTGKIDRDLNLSDVLKILERTGVHFKIEEGRKLSILN